VTNHPKRNLLGVEINSCPLKGNGRLFIKEFKGLKMPKPIFKPNLGQTNLIHLKKDLQN